LYFWSACDNLNKTDEQTGAGQERAVLVGAIPPTERRSHIPDNWLGELQALAESAGATVVYRSVQRMRQVHAATYIGSGKARELGEKVIQHAADVVIFDNDLTPAQIRELEKIVGVKVLDRSELILDIFATRARTKQAKLQVELAQLEYTYPRLTRMWGHLDSVAGAGGGTAAGAVGGIGTRGTGEKQLEIDRRIVSKRITELKREIEDIDKRKLREIDGRGGIYKICIVGYTNAGKSTLMNALTAAGVYVEDQLFATLDTRTRKWTAENGAETLISDTVGFVSKLPHHLVASFKATLEEAVSADLLLHVVDASSDEVFDQIKSVETVLEEIGCGDKEMLVLLNKSDRIANRELFDAVQTVYPGAISISAKTGYQLEQVAAAIAERVRGGTVRVRVLSHAGNGKLHHFLHTVGVDLMEYYDDSVVKIEVTLGKNHLAQLDRFGPTLVEIL